MKYLLLLGLLINGEVEIQHDVLRVEYEDQRSCMEAADSEIINEDYANLYPVEQRKDVILICKRIRE